jgi:FKBP12-rapamycin complex-associated protein
VFTLQQVKLLGVVGALDPFLHKQNQRALTEQTRVNEVQKEQPIIGQPLQAQDDVPAAALGGGKEAAAAPSDTPNTDDYFPTVAIQALMHILQEAGLSQHHNKVCSGPS